MITGNSEKRKTWPINTTLLAIKEMHVKNTETQFFYKWASSKKFNNIHGWLSQRNTVAFIDHSQKYNLDKRGGHFVNIYKNGKYAIHLGLTTDAHRSVISFSENWKQPECPLREN